MSRTGRCFWLEALIPQLGKNYSSKMPGDVQVKKVSLRLKKKKP
jgi:hypothetical protein